MLLQAYIFFRPSKRHISPSVSDGGSEVISAISARERGSFLDFRQLKIQSSPFSFFAAILQNGAETMPLSHWLPEIL